MLLRYFAAFLFTGVLSAQVPTASQAAELEKTLESKPDDEAARVRLLLYYRTAPAEGAKSAKHIVWFIEHDPANPILRHAGNTLGDGQKAVADAWKARFAGEPPVASVYINAASFFEAADPEYARKLAADGLARNPGHARIATQVGRLYGLAILGAKGLDRFGQVAAFDEALAKSGAADLARRELETTGNADVLAGAGDAISSQATLLLIRGSQRRSNEMSSLAEHYLDRALKLDAANPLASSALRRVYQSAAASERNPEKKLELLDKAAAFDGDPLGRSYILVDLAKAQFDARAYGKAFESATELIASAAKNPDNWNYGNAIHWGNIVLGRIALKDGKVEEAAKRLIAAGATPGSPQLNSFGPDWQLARDLANRGETGVVLEYIDECRKFWGLHRDSLDYWAKVIAEGGVPAFSRAETATGGRRPEAALAALVGKPAPAFSLKDLAGKTVALSDFQGKVVLLDFWATWCAPCRREMPAFDKLHREFAGKDVAIVTIDADEPAATAAQYLKDENLAFPVLIGEGTKVVADYGVVAFPTTLAIDADGRIAAFAVGGRSEAQLRELIAKTRR